MLRDDNLDSLVRPFGLRRQDLTFLRCSQNHVYRGTLPSGKSCIIRISHQRHRQPAEVAAELEWISHLAHRGLPVCTSIPTISGETFLALELDGESYLVACFDHAPGAAITPQPDDLLLHEKLGVLVGELHRESPFSSAFARPHWHESRLLGQDIATLHDRLTPAFRQSVAQIIDGLRSYPATPSNYGLIHGDVSFGNCFLNDDQLWIFDFDNCEHGFLLQDIATVLYDSIYCKVLNKFADAALTSRMVPLFQAFLSGYSQTGVIKEIDPSQLKKLFLLREAIIYIHYHRTLDIKTLNDSFKAGLEVMRLNVEQQHHQVDFDHLL